MVAASASLFPPGTAGNTVSREPGSWSPGRIGLPSRRERRTPLAQDVVPSGLPLFGFLIRPPSGMISISPRPAAMKPSDRVISLRRARPLLWKPRTSVAPAVTRSKFDPSCFLHRGLVRQQLLREEDQADADQTHGEAHAQPQQGCEERTPAGFGDLPVPVG